MQAFVNELLAAGLKPGTVSNVLNPVQAMYRRLVDDDALAHNPADRIDIPEPESRKPARIASRAEAERLLDALPAADRPLWATAMYAGLRRGELQALRWRDVDLAQSLIRVERGWDQYEGEQAPKTATSAREVPLLAVLRDYLDEYKLARRPEEDDLVFGRNRNAARAFVPSTIGKRARETWRAAGLEPITLHECRHTCASMLIDAGVNPKAVQTYLGHANIQITFDTYGHLMPGSHDQVRERMDAYLAPAEVEPVPAEVR